jgi:hypothetical protein
MLAPADFRVRITVHGDGPPTLQWGCAAMDLPTYKRAFRVKYRTIAEACGVTPATISFIASGHRRPSQALADKIELACGGYVRAAELRHDATEPFPAGNDAALTAEPQP